MNKSELKIIMKILGAQISLHDAVAKICKNTESIDAYESLGQSFKNIEEALDLVDKEASKNE